MPDDTCEQCRFSGFLKGLLGAKTYYCHRYPPHPIREVRSDGTADPYNLKNVHPKVEATGWCGEFQPAGSR